MWTELTLLILACCAVLVWCEREMRRPRGPAMPPQGQTMISITLPWPDPVLSPNSRIIHYDRAEAVRAARLEALALAHNAGAHLVGFPEGRIGMTVTFLLSGRPTARYGQLPRQPKRRIGRDRRCAGHRR